MDQRERREQPMERGHRAQWASGEPPAKPSGLKRARPSNERKFPKSSPARKFPKSSPSRLESRAPRKSKPAESTNLVGMVMQSINPTTEQVVESFQEFSEQQVDQALQ